MRGAALLLFGLIGLGLVGLWLYLPRHADAPALPAPDTQPLVVPGEELIEARAPGSHGTGRDALDPEKVKQAYSFDGKGIIRGHIGERAGVVFPREWDLVLEPDPYLQGRERAETRRIPFRAGERDFRVENLNLGGYRVRAEAAALNSSSADVLLVKGSPDQFVELAFSASGWMDGSVVDANDRPAEGLVVQLVESTTRSQITHTTDPAGAYEFRGLLDGDYELTLQAGGRPIGEPRSLSFRAPRLSFPLLKLPPTGTLSVVVLDLLGKPAVGVRVTGYGRPKGGIDLRTDEQGRVALRWALPGHWEISALDEGENLHAHGEVEVEAGAEATLPLRLAR